MTNVWDAADYLRLLYALWADMRACRQKGQSCQQICNVLGRDPLFDAADISAFDTIMAKVKAEGLSILAEGGTRLLDVEDASPSFGGWADE